jgi:hypothetical protein
MAPRRGPSSRAARPTGRIAEYLDTRRVKTIILGDIQAHRLALHDAGSDRRTDVVHPSEMAKADWCPAATSRRIMGYPQAETKFFFQTDSIFEEGHATHAKWQSVLADMEELEGQWWCRACLALCYASCPPRRTCPACGTVGALDYREVPLEALGEFLIAGHSDGFLPRRHALLEVKTIGEGTVRFDAPELLAAHTLPTADGKKVVDLPGLWNAINRPFPSHVRQGQIYLHLANLVGLNAEQIVFLYEYKPNQAVKEFSVRYNPERSAALFATAKSVRDHVAAGSPVPCPFGGCSACRAFGGADAPDPARPAPELPGRDCPSDPDAAGPGAAATPRRRNTATPGRSRGTDR